jgi:hypothetical protein
MGVEHMQAFKTSDGTLFDDERQAELHENKIRRNDAVTRWVDANLNADCFDCDERFLSVNAVIQAICEGHASLMLALSDPL